MTLPSSNQDISLFDGMDIYLIDQILKGRYRPGDRILDAGVGAGRNLSWFVAQPDLQLAVCDIEPEREAIMRERFPTAPIKWHTADLSNLPIESESLDHIICNAVLHFARDREHHERMWSEMTRVLRPKGSLFIRTCSDIGLRDKTALGAGTFLLPDESVRFLLTRDMIKAFCTQFGYAHLEAVKSTIVDDLRVMTTLMLVKVDGPVFSDSTKVG